MLRWCGVRTSAIARCSRAQQLSLLGLRLRAQGLHSRRGSRSRARAGFPALATRVSAASPPLPGARTVDPGRETARPAKSSSRVEHAHKRVVCGLERDLVELVAPQVRQRRPAPGHLERAARSNSACSRSTASWRTRLARGGRSNHLRDSASRAAAGAGVCSSRVRGSMRPGSTVAARVMPLPRAGPGSSPQAPADSPARPARSMRAGRSARRPRFVRRAAARSPSAAAASSVTRRRCRARALVAVRFAYLVCVRRAAVLTSQYPLNRSALTCSSGIPAARSCSVTPSTMAAGRRAGTGTTRAPRRDGPAAAPARSACSLVPARILGHREHDAQILVRALELLELVEERGGFAVAVRVDERHPVGKVLLGGVAEHAPEDGDPIPPATKTYGRSVSAGRTKSPFGCSTSTSAADGQLGERALERRVRRRVQSPSTPRSSGRSTTVRCRRGPFLSSKGGSSSVTQKYWPGWKSTSSPRRSKTTSSVSRATSRFSLIRAASTAEPKRRVVDRGQAREGEGAEHQAEVAHGDVVPAG